jgi:tetratricopeptide (TPR) repeat protein
MIGQTLEHFRLVERIGAGGMGVVYKAHDERLDRDVAIKVLPADSFQDPVYRARLLREARTASKLNHPNICTIHEVGEAEGRAFIAMELVEGGALPGGEVLRYGLHMADALAHAHKRGVVHRDFKSANVVVTPEGLAKVLDFGLALGYVELAHGARSREDSLHRAKAAAATALRLDDSLAEVQAAMGFVRGYYEWKWDEAFDHINKALEANPSLAIAYYHRSWFHALFGRNKEAIEDHIRARNADPFNPLHTAWLGELYRWEGRLDEAEAEALKSIEMDPNFPIGYMIQANVFQDRGMHDKAIEAMQMAVKAYPLLRWGLGEIYAKAGRIEEARGILAELTERPPSPWKAWYMAVNCIALGDLDEAFRWLEYEPHHAWAAWIRVIPGLKSLRQDPRFPDLLRRMNLPPR